MFTKKESKLGPTDQEIHLARLEMDSKAINHQFFLLVRDQKYQEALVLGSLYLRYFPENLAITKFCYFIEHNREQLLKMVDEEMNYTDDQDQEQQQDEGEEDDSEEDSQSVISNKSSVISAKSSVSSHKGQVAKPFAKKIPFLPVIAKTSQATVSTKSFSSTSTMSNKSASKINVAKIGKQNGVICKQHKWSHNCKNKECPNKIK